MTKKKVNEITPDFSSPLELEEKIPAHHYSVGHIRLFLEFVLSAATSLRGAARCQNVVKSFFNIPLAMPSWYSGRLWLMRLGYYMLTRPKTIADNWIWIIDHTVQIGCEKCFVVLGLRQHHLPKAGQCLQHRHLELIELLPVKQSNGTIVYEQLEAAAKKTGVPRAILCDHGSDIKSGVDQFCEVHLLTSSLYDITHKVACLLKKQLHEDTRWNEFTRFSSQVKSRLQQTRLAHLRPPKQRTKARYMNMAPLLRWAQRLLFLVTHPDQQDDDIKTLLGPITDFKEELIRWGETMKVCVEVTHYMRSKYLQSNSQKKLKTHLKDKLPELETPMAQAMQKQLLSFVGEQQSECYLPKERLPASSEVIESVFGKQKFIERDQSGNGFTGLVLAIGAIVSTLSDEIIKKAMTSVSTKEVITWCKKQIGQSVQAKQREVFSSFVEEQK